MCSATALIKRAFIALMLAALCQGLATAGETPGVVIATGIANSIQPIAWSPDGASIAAITGDDVVIYEVPSGGSRTLHIEGLIPSSIIWERDGLLVLGRTRLAGVMIRFDNAMKESWRLPVPAGSAIIFAAADGSGPLILGRSFSRSRIGLEVAAMMFKLDAGSGESVEVFRDSKILAERKVDLSMCGWAVIPPDPIEGKAVRFSCVSPPVLKPYVRIELVDPVGGKALQIAKREGLDIAPAGSWNPRGQRVALVDRDGALVLISRTGEITMPACAVNGVAPAWHPSGAAIYLGGCLVRPDGGTLSCPVSDGGKSRGAWSPDGTALAVINAGELRLLKTPALPGPLPLDAPLGKARADGVHLLKELLRDGFVTADEYAERLGKLIAPEAE